MEIMASTSSHSSPSTSCYFNMPYILNQHANFVILLTKFQLLDPLDFFIHVVPAPASGYIQVHHLSTNCKL